MSCDSGPSDCVVGLPLFSVIDVLANWADGGSTGSFGVGFQRSGRAVFASRVSYGK